MSDQLSLAQFGAIVKQKYPDYADYPDEEIGRRMLEKYPEYADRVSVEQPQSRGATSSWSETNEGHTFIPGIGSTGPYVGGAKSVGQTLLGLGKILGSHEPELTQDLRAKMTPRGSQEEFGAEVGRIGQVA